MKKNTYEKIGKRKCKKTKIVKGKKNKKFLCSDKKRGQGKKSLEFEDDRSLWSLYTVCHYRTDTFLDNQFYD
jgi:hypothetical protein